MSKNNLSTFLETIATDHYQFNFPINDIQKELTIMYLDKDDFNEGLMKAYVKIKRKYNEVLANVFLTTVERKLNIRDLDFNTMSYIEYQEKMDFLIDTLTNLVITRIEKRSPDGEVLTTMAGG